MKKALVLFYMLMSICFFSQEKEYKALVDSIQSNQWKLRLYDLDSLETKLIFSVKKNNNQNIIINEDTSINEHQTPITPFNLNKFYLPKKWHFYGQNNLSFNQASFSNWNKGGQNNIGVISNIAYHLSYKYNRHYLENVVTLGYGLNYSKGQSTRKTEDYINLMTNYGYNLGKNYYLSTGFQFSSQFSAGFNYDETPDPEYQDRISKFLAPAYLNLGIGFSYNPRENFQIIFRPVNGKLTIVSDPFLQKEGLYGLKRDGQSLRMELGAMFNAIYRLHFYKDIYLDNRLTIFCNYIEHPERVDFHYNGILHIKFNRFITTMVSLDLAYDHDQIEKLQTKQTLSVGLSYQIGKEMKRKKKTIRPFINS